MNLIFKSPEFDKYVYKYLSRKQVNELYSFIERLRFNFNLGKPLSYGFFREKKLGGERVYFLVYDEIKLILLVGVSNKKTQRVTIDYIKLYLSEFKTYAYELYYRGNED